MNCKQVRKATDLITNPSARELYAREFEDDSVHFSQWERAFEASRNDSLQIDLPYSETGTYFSKLYRSYAYDFHLQKGESLFVDVETDSVGKKVFLDLYNISTDSLATLKHIKSNDKGKVSLEYSVEQSGEYKLIVQPEITTTTRFFLRTYTKPLFGFPVAGKDNKAIQSFWGAARDGGKRSHEGLDIFADRGTPVLAVADGRVSSTGNRGLGGKQVWQRTGMFGYALYYAHLDSILVSSGANLKTGDTLGLVGNTGNARTTSPHLHFGIYEGYRGAIDPLPFVQISEIPEFDYSENQQESPFLVINASRANLRNSPTTKGQKIGEAIKNDTLSLLGKTDAWAHIQNKEGRKAFVHLSLATIPVLPN
ncbi:peptidoglycan DD-metalloendopeptidase family protein [Zobellia roscoffensis]|uniref:peptidoglycan DD-metalloendopeptidase family protein n=1 Tax=Zobellia roscoffensis TaxID=2779508 RepID=UPI00188AC811|nr:M23 family metallopeptidase [Zobellia roscoffensis]